ncbi:MAG: hypothetical protein HQL33_08515 [Alphaproteobacteria bacterium]|nr:hypothetical protein [Alphaproteobacteria bacterium]MBF0130023.1 hypothetical protein [Alphaproteobacteria bacterium]
MQKKPPQQPRVPRLRLLPFLIFAAVLMMTVKLGGIWEGVNGSRRQVTVEQSKALAQPSAPEAPKTAVASLPAAESPREKASGKATEKADEGKHGAPQDLGDPASFTQNEIDLLQKLAARREELDGRGRELDARDALLNAAEERIDLKIGEIKTLEETIRKLIAQYNQLEDNKVKNLVGIYEKMKPKDAARIFNELEMPTLLAVIERMKDTKTAPIMAQMDSAKAKALTSELIQRNRLPVPAEAGQDEQ